MADLVVTVPPTKWAAWLASSDLVGQPESDREHTWLFDRGTQRPPIAEGDRLYVVSCRLLRGYAPVVRVEMRDGRWAVVRRGGAVAVTLPEPVTGFPGWRMRWWDRSAELAFPDWQRAATSADPRSAERVIDHLRRAATAAGQGVLL